MAPVAFNFIHINIMSGSDSSLAEKTVGRATPENTMVKTKQISAFRRGPAKLSKSEVFGKKKTAAKKLLLRKINKELRRKEPKKAGGVSANKRLGAWNLVKKLRAKGESAQSTKRSKCSRDRKNGSSQTQAKSKSQSRLARVNPKGEYGVQVSKSVRPQEKLLVRRKTRSRNNSDQSGEVSPFGANRHSDPGKKLGRKFALPRKPRAEAAEPGRAASLQEEKKALKTSIYSRIRRKVKRPIKRTPLIASKRLKLGFLERRRSPEAKPKSKSRSKKQTRAAKGGWLRSRKTLREGATGAKRAFRSAKMGRREPRFGKKLRKAAKPLRTEGIREEDEESYFAKDRSKSTKTGLRGGARLLLLLHNLGGKGESANNIRERCEGLNESQSVDKMAKKPKFKALWRARLEKPKKTDVISSSKKLKNLTGRPYVPKFRSGRGQGEAPKAFNEYDTRERRTPGKAPSKSIRKMFGKKYSDQLKKFSSKQLLRSEARSPFQRAGARPRVLASPRARKFRSNKEILGKPFARLKKSPRTS